MSFAERMDRLRIVALLAELRRLDRRQREVRLELAELLERPRTPDGDEKLGELLQRLGEVQP